MLTVLRPRLVPNSTEPVASANSVSSPPRPTLTPGWNLVPRWRTRISPALTTCPPNRLTPSRLAVESRPLRELDAPFLCAIAAGIPLLADAGDLDAGQPLPVALALVVAGLVLELVDPDLGALGLLDHPAGDGDLGELVRAGGQLAVVHQEQRRQRDLGTRLAGKPLDVDDVADGHLVLLAAGLDDGVHVSSLISCCSSCRCYVSCRKRRMKNPPRGGPKARVRGLLAPVKTGSAGAGGAVAAAPGRGERLAQLVEGQLGGLPLPVRLGAFAGLPRRDAEQLDGVRPARPVFGRGRERDRTRQVHPGPGRIAEGKLHRTEVHLQADLAHPVGLRQQLLAPLQGLLGLQEPFLGDGIQPGGRLGGRLDRRINAGRQLCEPQQRPAVVAARLDASPGRRVGPPARIWPGPGTPGTQR